MAKDQGQSAPNDLNSLLNQIAEACEYSRAAVGAATQYIKKTQHQLRSQVGNVVTAEIPLPISEFGKRGGYFKDLEWNGKHIVVVSGRHDIEYEDCSHKPALELPGGERIEVVKALPSLVAAILDAAKKQAEDIGRLSDPPRNASTSLIKEVNQ